ncbi:MAG: THUMP domain-containing class I SAM-dependent RNA methyltransferase, partial [Bacillota bacterium]
TSGQGLHKRGYRDMATEAPLQETIAAGMIYLSKWEPDRILIDPFCGSGTIPIEAAMMGKNMAPGLKRKFVAQDWPLIPQKTWEGEFERARAEIKEDPDFRLLMGLDRDEDAIGIARFHARQADVLEYIHFQEKDFSDFDTSRKYGYVITNPPYGERLGEKEDVEELYQLMGEKLLPLETWSYYILSAHSKFEKHFGKKASKRRKLYNGGIECQYYQYYGPWPPKD